MMKTRKARPNWPATISQIEKIGQMMQ